MLSRRTIIFLVAITLEDGGCRPDVIGPNFFEGTISLESLNKTSFTVIACIAVEDDEDTTREVLELGPCPDIGKINTMLISLGNSYMCVCEREGECVCVCERERVCV